MKIFIIPAAAVSRLLLNFCVQLKISWNAEKYFLSCKSNTQGLDKTAKIELLRQAKFYLQRQAAAAAMCTLALL